MGPKSAQRLAFWLVKAPPEDAKRLAAAIVAAKDRIAFCRECGNVAEGDLCRVCRDESRDRTQGAATAPPEGLYLWQVHYPEAFGLPVRESGPTSAMIPGLPELMSPG